MAGGKEFLACGDALVFESPDCGAFAGRDVGKAETVVDCPCGGAARMDFRSAGLAAYEEAAVPVGLGEHGGEVVLAAVAECCAADGVARQVVHRDDFVDDDVCDTSGAGLRLMGWRRPLGVPALSSS